MSEVIDTSTLDTVRGITIIVAMDNNRVIGKDGKIPWYIPEDMAMFKATTTGHTVIMGRKTWESLPATKRPLPDRDNIVITRNKSYEAPGAKVAHSLKEALKLCDHTKYTFVIGGAEIYKEALPIADRMLVTELGMSCEGNVKFPPFTQDWCIDKRFNYVSKRDRIHYAVTIYVPRLAK